MQSQLQTTIRSTPPYTAPSIDYIYTRAPAGEATATNKGGPSAGGAPRTPRTARARVRAPGETDTVGRRRTSWRRISRCTVCANPTSKSAYPRAECATLILRIHVTLVVPAKMRSKMAGLVPEDQPSCMHKRAWHYIYEEGATHHGLRPYKRSHHVE